MHIALFVPAKRMFFCGFLATAQVGQSGNQGSSNTVRIPLMNLPDTYIKKRMVSVRADGDGETHRNVEIKLEETS